jgi:hypothetical protein
MAISNRRRRREIYLKGVFPATKRNAVALGKRRGRLDWIMKEKTKVVGSTPFGLN